MIDTDRTSIQALSSAVLQEAQSRAEQIVAAAKVQAAQIRQEAEKQAAEERGRILAQAQQEAERIRREATAAAELQARMLRLERREKLLDRVFAAVRQQLPLVPQRQDYGEIVRALVLEAVKHIDSEVAEIQADPQTQPFLTADVLAALSRAGGVQLQLGPALTEGVGVIAQTPDGHRRYDNTLQARLSRRQDALRTAVYHILMGEPA